MCALLWWCEFDFTKVSYEYRDKTEGHISEVHLLVTHTIARWH